MPRPTLTRHEVCADPVHTAFFTELASAGACAVAEASAVETEDIALQAAAAFSVAYQDILLRCLPEA